LTAMSLSLSAAEELQLLCLPLAISACRTSSAIFSSPGAGAALLGSSEYLSSAFLLRLFWGEQVEVGGSMLHGAY
jgi:hypothetical protein